MMNTRCFLLFVVVVGVTIMSTIFFVDNTSTAITPLLPNQDARYQQKIQVMHDEMALMKQEIESLKWSHTEFAKNFECQEPRWCDTHFADSPTIQSYIYNLQHPKDCNTARFLVLPGEYYSGVGSSIHIKNQFFGLAVHHNRTFILPDNAEWTFSHVCNPPTSECYFEPITHCKTGLHLPDWRNAPIMRDDKYFPDERVVRLNDQYLYTAITGFSRVKFVPSMFAYKDFYWWHAQVTKYLVRPNAYSREIVLNEQKKMFPPYGIIPHPMISMYVRHGDKYKEATLLPLSAYMDTIQGVADEFNIKHIYLGTDDPQVITEALANYTPRFTFHYIETKRYNGGPLEIVSINNGADLMNVSIADLFIQPQGDIFAGTRTSNWCRLIDELRKVNGKGRVHFYHPEKASDFFYEN